MILNGQSWSHMFCKKMGLAGPFPIHFDQNGCWHSTPISTNSLCTLEVIWGTYRHIRYLRIWKLITKEGEVLAMKIGKVSEMTFGRDIVDFRQ